MIQRTTIAAERDDLEVLRAEAKRRELSFAQYLRLVLAEKATDIQSRRRPRFGVGRSDGSSLSVALESVDDEDSPARGSP
ncbi:MAG: hypothetical protein ACR2RB_11050 [Gammaproteobacteria bacterium]